MSSRNLNRPVIAAVLLLLIGTTFLLRTWALNSVPPWLWWDEASQGLDARELLGGHFQVFFPRALGKEPLYIYLTTPFVAAWDGKAFAVRLAGAMLGVLMIPTLYAAGRALWREHPTAGIWAGLATAGFWAANFWPQSINRIGFQVNAFPLVLSLAVVTWLNWTHHPTRRRALIFGLLAGLALATYLAARITPLLWVFLYVTLPGDRRRALRPSLPWAILTFGLVVLPLGFYFLLHPEQAFQRTGTFAAFYQQPTLAAQALLLLDSFLQVAGGFLGWAGDPIPRHNIPNRPPFSPVLAALFAVGLVLALVSLRRRPPGTLRGDRRAWTLLIWLVLLSLPALVSANSNPHFPRLLGALPAALLLAAWPVAWIAGFLRPRRRFVQVVAGSLLALLLLGETVRTAQAYFLTWARDPNLYTWFQGDLWTVGARVADRPGAIGIIPLDPSSGDALDYAFPNAQIAQVQVKDDTIESWLDDHLGSAGGALVMVPAWQTEPYVYADPQERLPFYLSREGDLSGEDHYPGYDLLSYALGNEPQFKAAGQSQPLDQAFGPDLTLVGARWGAAYPNPDRNGTTAAAGTPFWVILTWRLGRPRTDLRVALDLVDPAGHRLASTEAPLRNVWADTQAGPYGGVDEDLAPSTGSGQAPSRSFASSGGQASSPGQDSLLRTYHLLTVPVTQAPGPVMLEARVYNTNTLIPVQPIAGTARSSAPVAAAAVDPAIHPLTAEALKPARPLPATLGPNLSLLGLDAWPDTIAPGQVLSLRPYLRQMGQIGQGVETTASDTRGLILSLGGTPVSTTTALPVSLPAGQVVQTYLDLRVPADLPAGTYPLVLASFGGEGPVSVGQVTVAGRSRRYEVPPELAKDLLSSRGTSKVNGHFGDSVTLLGVASAPAATSVSAGVAVHSSSQPLTLTLVWRPLRTPEEGLVRFVHLLGPDGRPVAQRDSIPCAGTCPAPSWLPGEVLLDDVTLDIPATLPAGTYPVAVGWYFAATSARLPAYDSDGVRVPNDLYVLPLQVRVVP